MKTISGDLIKLAQSGHFDVIVHGCNCFCNMAGGIAKGIKHHFPEAWEADKQTEAGNRNKLGSIHWANHQTEHGNLIVVNAYTQFDFRGRGVKVDYEAVRKCFREIKKQFSGLRIGYPGIGAGLAGGDWSIISEIIAKELEGEDHTFVFYKP